MATIEQDPEAWSAYYHAAQLQEDMKRLAQAQKHYQALAHVDEYREVATAAVERIGNTLADIAASMAGEQEPPMPPPGGAAGTGPIGPNATRPL
ncbi:hypothetical protein D3C72_1464520 [compost metagenome]